MRRDDRQGYDSQGNRMGTMGVSAEDVFGSFVAAINGHDVEALTMLMTLDHAFYDSIGIPVVGAAQMQVGWSGYFAMCPDYWIRVDDVAAKDGMVLAVGKAGGTIDGETWSTPAAWKAIIRDGKVAEWRVFADNQPVREILARRQSR